MSTVYCLVKAQCRKSSEPALYELFASTYYFKKMAFKHWFNDWKSCKVHMDIVIRMPIVIQVFFHGLEADNSFCLPPSLQGMKTWLDSLCRKPGSCTTFLVLFLTTVWRSGSSITPGAAVTYRLGRSSPLSVIPLPLQRIGEWSYPLTWLHTLRLLASHFCSSWDTRQFFIPKSCEIFRTLWWRRGRLPHILSDQCHESVKLCYKAKKKNKNMRIDGDNWNIAWSCSSLTDWSEF